MPAPPHPRHSPRDPLAGKAVEGKPGWEAWGSRILKVSRLGWYVEEPAGASKNSPGTTPQVFILETFTWLSKTPRKAAIDRSCPSLERKDSAAAVGPVETGIHRPDSTPRCPFEKGLRVSTQATLDVEKVSNDVDGVDTVVGMWMTPQLIPRVSTPGFHIHARRRWTTRWVERSGAAGPPAIGSAPSSRSTKSGGLACRSAAGAKRCS